MRILAYERFRASYQQLPHAIQRKVDKQLRFLAENLRHPSLQVKRIKATEGLWEARVDLHYRMTFEVIGETIYLRVVGNHDEVLRRPQGLTRNASGSVSTSRQRRPQGHVPAAVETISQISQSVAEWPGGPVMTTGPLRHWATHRVVMKPVLRITCGLLIINSL